MTYGWAILLVAVVLAALFELGIFNHGFGASTCIPIPGFVCENPVYTANAISFTFGQNTGRDTYGDWVFIASQGEALNSGGIPVNFTTLNALPVGIGANRGLVPGQTVSVDFTNFAAGGIPPGTPVGTDFAGYVWLGYCTSAPCTAPTNYEKVATMTLVSVGGTVLRGSTPTGSISNPFNFGGGWQGAGDYYDVPGNPPGQPVYVATQSQYEAYATTTTISCPRCATTTSTSITTTTSTTTTASTTSTSTTTTTTTSTSTTTTSTMTQCFNLASGTCNGDLFYTQSMSLTGPVEAANSIFVQTSITLTTNGAYMVANTLFDNSGTITAGSSPNGGIDCCTSPPNYPSSYGGSGGGGTGLGGASSGGSTLASGGGAGSGGCCGGSGSNGNTPSEPSLTDSQVANMVANGIQNYLRGAGGGYGYSCCGGGSGGYGSYGIYIQAGEIVNNGAIDAPGISATVVPGGGGNGGSSEAGGGGGGGAILLAYGTGPAPGGSYNVNYGVGSGACCGWTGGHGGMGQVIDYQYTSPPVTPPSP